MKGRSPNDGKRDSSSRSNRGEGVNPWTAVDVIVPYIKRYTYRLIFGFLALISVDFLQLWIPMV
ncbi:MAG: hypothetical protein RBS57_19035, partial [Desulforhabdus sp.]|nr:hypothetical protein [Desulforhabdus sp.]